MAQQWTLQSPEYKLSQPWNPGLEARAVKKHSDEMLIKVILLA